MDPTSPRSSAKLYSSVKPSFDQIYQSHLDNAQSPEGFTSGSVPFGDDSNQVFKAKSPEDIADLMNSIEPLDPVKTDVFSTATVDPHGFFRLCSYVFIEMQGNLSMYDRGYASCNFYEFMLVCGWMFVARVMDLKAQSSKEDNGQKVFVSRIAKIPIPEPITFALARLALADLGNGDKLVPDIIMPMMDASVLERGKLPSLSEDGYKSRCVEKGMSSMIPFGLLKEEILKVHDDKEDYVPPDFKTTVQISKSFPKVFLKSLPVFSLPYERATTSSKCLDSDFKNDDPFSLSVSFNEIVLKSYVYFVKESAMYELVTFPRNVVGSNSLLGWCESSDSKEEKLGNCYAAGLCTSEDYNWSRLFQWRLNIKNKEDCFADCRGQGYSFCRSPVTTRKRVVSLKPIKDLKTMLQSYCHMFCTTRTTY